MMYDLATWPCTNSEYSRDEDMKAKSSNHAIRCGVGHQELELLIMPAIRSAIIARRTRACENPRRTAAEGKRGSACGLHPRVSWAFCRCLLDQSAEKSPPLRQMLMT